VALKTYLHCDFGLGEEVADFDGGVFVRIRAMHRVGFDRFGEFLADRAGIGIGRVGGAHDGAIGGDGVFAFQHLDDDRAGDHEGDEFTEEAAFAVDGVETFGLGLGQVQALLRDDAQAGGFDHGVDGAGQVAAGRIGLDDRKGARDGHRGILD